MKKKLLSLLLALCLVAGLVPTAVFAAGDLPTITEYRLNSHASGLSRWIELSGVNPASLPTDVYYVQTLTLAGGGTIDYGDEQIPSNLWVEDLASFMDDTSAITGSSIYLFKDMNNNETYDEGTDIKGETKTITTPYTHVYSANATAKEVSITSGPTIDEDRYNEYVLNVGSEFTGKGAHIYNSNSGDYRLSGEGVVAADGSITVLDLNNTFDGNFTGTVLGIVDVAGDASAGYTQTITTYPITSGGVNPPADNLSISNMGFDIVDGKVVLEATFTGGTVTNSSGYNYKITDSTGNEEFSVSSYQAEDNVSNNVLTSSFMNYADADMYTTVNYNNVAMRVYQDHETAAFDEDMTADVQHTKLNSPTNAVNLTVVPQRSNTALTPIISGDNVTFSTLANQSVEIYAKSTATTPVFSGMLDANGMATITDSSFTGTFGSGALIAVFTAGESSGTFTQNITSYAISSGSVTPPTGTVLNGNFNIDADTGAYSLNLGLPSGVTVASDINAVSGITFKTASGNNLVTNAYAQESWSDIKITFDETDFAIGEYTITAPKALLTGATADVTCVFNVTQERIDDAERYVDESIIHEYLKNTYSYDFSDGSGTLPSGFTQSAFLTELNDAAQYGTTVSYMGTPTYTAPTETTQGSFSATIKLTNGTKTSTTAIDFGVEKVPAIPAHNLIWDTANLATNGVNANFGDVNFTETASSTTATGVNAISYESGETSVATINPTSGEVTIVGAGRATITATAAAVAGQYRETSITYTLTVSAKALTESMLTINPTSYTFTGNAITPTFTVSDGGITLAENTDYTVSVTNNTNVGTSALKPTVTITGINNYSGNASETFSITQKTATNDTPTKADAVTYSNTGEQVVDLSDIIPADAGTITSINVSKPSSENGGDLISTTLGDTSAKTANYTLANNLTSANIGNTVDLIANVATQNYKTIFVTITVTISDKADQDSFGFAGDDKTVIYGAADYILAAKGAVTGSTVEYTSSDRNIATVDLSTGEVTILKAGSTVITATAGSTADYNQASDSYTLTVSKAPLTITAPTLSIYEGDDMPTLTLSYNGFVKGESPTVFSSAPTPSTTADKDVPGNYAITVINIPTDSNYNIAAVNGTLTVIDKVSAVLPPQQDIADNTTSDEPVIALGTTTAFTDVDGNPISTPANADMRISMASAVSTPDKTALDSGLTDPNAGTVKVFLELSLMAGGTEILPNGEVEIFIPYSKISPVTQSSVVKLLHLKSDNTYETIIPEMLANGIRFKADGLSPFVIYDIKTAAPSNQASTTTTTTSSDPAISPQTGVYSLQTNNTLNFLFVLMLLLSGSVVTVFILRKNKYS